ncbi:hypothetical protein IC229_16955 [Spirosoma sp. BT702]|uniref:Uncharacterized protein n=1 Tax=Spirosoma profusum TaxID=2771354 RepID=A0A927ARJ4_9BACT|nr:hypothetical protein [Spirosoma profusum]MBD2702341.1 hypothetical protein [Spirosoma profusum]
MQTIDKRISAGLLAFWALYFSIVLLSNSADALKSLSILPTGWPFASGNYELIVKVLSIYSSPVWVAVGLFVGVILWEALGAFLFWKAFLEMIRQTPSHKVAIHRAFGITLGLWAAFLLSDEIFLAYLVGDITTTHFNLLIAELASFILIRL